MRFRKEYNWPFGYTVRVVLLSHKKFLKQHKKTFPADGEMGSAFCNEVGFAESVIYLDKSRPVGKLVADVGHEMGHIYVEYVNYLNNLPGTDVRG